MRAGKIALDTVVDFLARMFHVAHDDPTIFVVNAFPSEPPNFPKAASKRHNRLHRRDVRTFSADIAEMLRRPI